jgi:HK97 family phage portal protein
VAAFQTLVELGEAMGHETSPGMVVADPGVPVSRWDDADITDVWRSQPSVRKVLDFKARLIASTSLHCYSMAEGGRERDRTSPVARMLADPERSGATTPYAFWSRFVLDRLIYDRAAAIILDGQDGVPQLARIPARRWKPVVDSFDRVTGVTVFDARGHGRRLSVDQFVLVVGYAQRGGAGTSPVTTLSDLITEMREAVTYRRGMWQRGARASMMVLRDKPWASETARDRFLQGFREFSRGGSREGGTGLLEDGMKVEQLDQWSPQNVQDLEGRRLSDIEVASFFQIPPEMVGARQGNYSNMDAFRQMLYRDTLGPDIVEWEQAVDLGMRHYLADGQYVEANVEGKLRGSFQEQAAVLTQSTGGPYMLRSEARERMNLPPIDGDDELIVPLNVLVGGQSSPLDGGQGRPPSPSSHSSGSKADPGVPVKTRAPDSHETKHTQVMRDFFARQSRSVRAKLGAGQDWWDGTRWDLELTNDLTSLHLLSATVSGRSALEAAGLDPGDYDEDRTVAFLRESAARSAQDINMATLDQLVTATDTEPDADDPLPGEDKDPVQAVFDAADQQRAPQIAATAVTFASGFGVVESARQRGGSATKTWRVTSQNPRPQHKALDGQTVGLDEAFSNGLPWPGAAGSDADEVAGCKCAIDIDY